MSANALMKVTGWDEEQVKLVKEQIAPDATEGELMLFGMVCNRTGLDPFVKQIHAIHRWNSNANKKIMTIQVSIDGFRAIAQRTGKYNSNKTFWCGKDGVWKEVWLEDKEPAAAMTIVTRTDASGEFVGVAKWSSYKPNEKMDFIWRGKPDVMIGKCSEALALRKAFPAELGGVYAPEEMISSPQEPITVEANSGVNALKEVVKARKNSTEKKAVEAIAPPVPSEIPFPMPSAFDVDADGVLVDAPNEAQEYAKFEGKIKGSNGIGRLNYVGQEISASKISDSKKDMLRKMFEDKKAELKAIQDELSDS